MGACAKGETYCVQMNVNVEEQGMHAFKVEYIRFFCYRIANSVRNNLCILFRIGMSSRHLSMKAVEFEPSLSAIAFGTCFFRLPNATLETLEMSSISLQEKTEQLDTVK